MNQKNSYFIGHSFQFYDDWSKYLEANMSDKFCLCISKDEFCADTAQDFNWHESDKLWAAHPILVKSAANGDVPCVITRLLRTGLNIAGLALNVMAVWEICSRFSKKKPEDTTDDEKIQLFQIFFFVIKKIVNFKSADTLVKDAQQRTINSFKKLLNGDACIMNFDNALKNTTMQSGIMHGNAYLIRALKPIDKKNLKEFFDSIDIDNTATNRFKSQGLMIMNEELVIHPKSYMQISKKQREIIITHSTDLWKKKSPKLSLKTIV